MGYDFAEKDLAHIRNVLNHLERPAGSGRAGATGAVVDLHYWRARVRTILAMPLLSIHVETQARDLLRRLDQLDDARFRARIVT